MSDDVNLDKIMTDIFGAQQESVEDKKFFVNYDTLHKITSFGPLNGDGEYIFVDRAVFDELSNSTVGNYIVDVTNNTVIDISGNQTAKNSRIPQVTNWVSTSIASLSFVKSTRQLHINVRTQLPTPKTVWIVPRGNYMIPLLTIQLQNAGETVLDVPKFLDSNSCQLLSETYIEIFTSFREVDNESDL